MRASPGFSSLLFSELSRAAQARVKSPKTRGRFARIDAARRQLGLLEVADSFGQMHISWLVDVSTGRIEDSRFLAFGSLASHAIGDVFTESVRGRTVAEAAQLTEEQMEALLRDDPTTPAFSSWALQPAAFLADLQSAAVAALPQVVVLPMPAEAQAYVRKRKQDWDVFDSAWLPLSLLKKIKRVEDAAIPALATLAPGAGLTIEGLHDDLRVVIVLTGIEASAVATVTLALQDRLRPLLHPHLIVEAAPHV